MCVQNVTEDSMQFGPEKIKNIKDVEFCNIYHRRKTQLSFIEGLSFEKSLCTQFTIVHIKQTNSVT